MSKVNEMFKEIETIISVIDDPKIKEQALKLLSILHTLKPDLKDEDIDVACNEKVVKQSLDLIKSTYLKISN